MAKTKQTGNKKIQMQSEENIIIAWHKNGR